VTWEAFVIAFGWRARKDHLAHVVGRPVDEVEQFRRHGVCQRGRRRAFAELFTLRHGRAPKDGEWPLPKRCQRHYEWLTPELTLLARLVGTMSVPQIARVLTVRLRKLTGDSCAARNRTSVQIAINRTGLQASDLVGGLTTREAGTLAGSLAIVQQAIDVGRLETRRVGHRHVIPRDAFAAWLAARDRAPEGWVRLASLRVPLGIRSDSKLPEYAKHGYIPDTVLVKSSNLWFIKPERAAQILADARAGRPLPWHGQPLIDNVLHSWRLWRQRRHAADCALCRKIWGRAGPPDTLDAFLRRYPPLDLGLKRHLTSKVSPRRRTFTPRRPWGSCRAFRGVGVTIAEAARELGRPAAWVRSQIALGVVRPVVDHFDAGAAQRITPAGMRRLAASTAEARRGRPPGQWLGVHAAAAHTGVSIGTIHLWGRQRRVVGKRGARGLLFSLSSLERQARAYWARCRYLRATPPAWLRKDAAA
jgi:hypothetical protein